MPRPSVKSTLPHFYADGAVHFRMAGELLSIEDTDGRIGQLLKLLDGTRDTDEIFSALTALYPDTTRAEFDKAIADLDDSGLLHDAAAPVEGLTAEHCERWSRNLGFFETFASMAVSKYAYQKRVRTTKVAMLGVGGVGSHVLMDIVALGFTDIRVVDFDTVALSNLNRQVLYGEHCLGRPKVGLAKQWVERFNSEVDLDVVEKKLSSADDVYAVVHDRDIVVAAIDRPKTTALLWLNEGCVRAGAAFVTGGVDTQRAVHYTVVPGVSGCIECWRSSVHAQDETSRKLFDRLHEQEDAGLRFGEDMAAFDGLVVLQTAFLVGELVRLATAVSPPLSVGRLLQVLFQCPVLVERESWTRDPNCRVCGDARLPARFGWLPAAITPAPSLQPVGVWSND
jgi:molybdopterin/thiamine biosynthesis adenylyltransferase